MSKDLEKRALAVGALPEWVQQLVGTFGPLVAQAIIGLLEKYLAQKKHLAGSASGASDCPCDPEQLACLDLGIHEQVAALAHVLCHREHCRCE